MRFPSATSRLRNGAEPRPPGRAKLLLSREPRGTLSGECGSAGASPSRRGSNPTIERGPGESAPAEFMHHPQRKSPSSLLRPQGPAVPPARGNAPGPSALVFRRAEGPAIRGQILNSRAFSPGLGGGSGTRAFSPGWKNGQPFGPEERLSVGAKRVVGDMSLPPWRASGPVQHRMGNTSAVHRHSFDCNVPSKLTVSYYTAILGSSSLALLRSNTCSATQVFCER